MTLNKCIAGLLVFALLCNPGSLLSASSQNLSTNTTYRQAYDRGYADGLQSGTKDREDGRPFEYANKRAFQRADQGFDPARDNQETYRLAYRRGFEDGYEDGYELKESHYASPASDVTTPPPAPLPVGSDRTAQKLSAGTDAGLVVPVGTEIKVKLLDTLSTQRNQRGDPFRAEVVEDIRFDQRVLVPGGARLSGTISSIRRAGRIKGRAEMVLDFETLELPDGTRIPVEASVVSIEKRPDSSVKEEEGVVQGEATKSEDAANVGKAAALGALIGVLAGGKRGARTGATAGTVTGLAGVLMTRGRDLRLYSETELTIRLDRELNLPR